MFSSRLTATSGARRQRTRAAVRGGSLARLYPRATSRSSQPDTPTAPHVVIGWRKGFKYPVAIQCIPFDRAGRALQHPSGPETNRANAIQIEICGRAAESHTWDANWYKALANLALLIEHRVDIPQKAPRSFPGTGTRATGS
jgi:hypothetical protein